MKHRIWLIVFVVWTLLALPYASHLYLYLTMRGFKTTWTIQLIEALAATNSRAIVTPLILDLANRYPLLSTRHSKVAIHLPAAFAISFFQVILHTIADAFLIHWWSESLQLWSRFTSLFSRTYFFGLIVYALVLCLHTAFEIFKKKELESAQIRAEIAENELKLLKAQLQPHFLFNTLNTIVSMIYQDPPAAHAMISKLSGLLRMILEHGTDHTIPLKQEFELVKIYLEIEKVRFQNRLDVEFHVDRNLSDVRIPCMILQPIVENSIRHGMEHAECGARIVIAATQLDSSLQLSVRDNGNPRSTTPGTEDSFHGTGLLNLKKRLERLYGTKAQLKTGPLPEAGFEVNIVLPL